MTTPDTAKAAEIVELLNRLYDPRESLGTMRADLIAHFKALSQRPTDTARAGEVALQAWQHFPGTEINEAPADWDGRAVLCSDGKVYLIPPGWSWCKVGDLPFVVAYTITFGPIATPSPVTDETALSGDPGTVTEIAKAAADATVPEDGAGYSREKWFIARDAVLYAGAALASTPQPAVAEDAGKAALIRFIQSHGVVVHFHAWDAYQLADAILAAIRQGQNEEER